MARKPKVARSNAFAVSPEEVLAALSDAPAPLRPGRKPKATASPEPLAAMDSDDAVAGSADADGSIAGSAAAPMRRRSGPKPKQRAGGDAAAPLRKGARVRIPMKPPGYTDLKPPVVPISKRPPFQSQTARDGVVS